MGGTLTVHARLIAEQLRDTLCYLHRAGVLHLDIKPQNVVWGEEIRHTYIIDLILAEQWPTQKTELTRQYGTQWYRAPELNTKLPASAALLRPALDCWSLGCTLYELGGASPLFASKTITHASLWVGKPDAWLRHVPATISHAVACLLGNIDKREVTLRVPLV